MDHKDDFRVVNEVNNPENLRFKIISIVEKNKKNYLISLSF